MNEKNSNKEMDDKQAKAGVQGTVKISDDVVTTIAYLAAGEVEGVKEVSFGSPERIMDKLGISGTSKGVHVVIEQGSVSVELGIVLAYSANITLVCKRVQDKVRTSIEGMTGLSVEEVNIRVAGVEGSK